MAWTKVLIPTQRSDHFLPCVVRSLKTFIRRDLHYISEAVDRNKSILIFRKLYFTKPSHISSRMFGVTGRGLARECISLKSTRAQALPAMNKCYILFLNFPDDSKANGKRGATLVKNPTLKKQHSLTPPLLWKIVLTKLLSEFMAIITGHYLQMWWKSLPADKTEYFEQIARTSQWKVVSLALLVSGMIYVLSGYYYNHLEETPFTARKRLVIFTPEEMKEVSDFLFQGMLDEKMPLMLATGHPSYERAATVANRLVTENNLRNELPDKSWTVSVVNDVPYSFVFPNGQIFISTGLLNLCSNDDQLGFTVAHEMAHCVLSHGVETMSYWLFLEVWVIFTKTMFWALMPSVLLSFGAHMILGELANVLFFLPYCRMLEIEADEVGLLLAAKACFNVRESTVFWEKIEALCEAGYLSKDIEFLSTHPSNETRMNFLQSIMEKTVELRKSYGCPPLVDRGTHFDIELLLNELDNKM